MDQRAETLLERLLGAFRITPSSPRRAGDRRRSVPLADRSLDGTTKLPTDCRSSPSRSPERAGVVELGVGYDPSRDECFVAERGQGDHERQAIRV
jgi:hypothetical protein